MRYITRRLCRQTTYFLKSLKSHFSDNGKSKAIISTEVRLIRDACEELDKFSASYLKQTHSCLHSACGYYLIECALWCITGMLQWALLELHQNQRQKRKTYNPVCFSIQFTPSLLKLRFPKLNLRIHYLQPFLAPIFTIAAML